MNALYREFLDQMDDECYDVDVAEDFKQWLIKNNYPGAELSDKEVLDIVDKERINCKQIRDLAMTDIIEMTAKEFQTKLFDGTLPDFPRAVHGDVDYPVGLIRDTCHSHCLLTDDDFYRNNTNNYAEAHRDRIRFTSAKNFKELCYYGLINNYNNVK